MNTMLHLYDYRKSMLTQFSKLISVLDKFTKNKSTLNKIFKVLVDTERI